MIRFNKFSQETPYLVFIENYKKAFSLKQENIEAICISSYSKKFDEVNSRFVNLKYINDKEFIFFSNHQLTVIMNLTVKVFIIDLKYDIYKWSFKLLISSR